MAVIPGSIPQAERRRRRIVAAARALLAEPDSMPARKAYLQATFNQDVTARAIADLADRVPQLACEALDLKDGDILMVRAPENLSIAEIEGLRAQLHRVIDSSGVRAKFFVTLGFDAQVVRPAEADQ